MSAPRIGLVTITDLIMGEGGKSARVFVTVVGDEKEVAQTVEGLWRSHFIHQVQVDVQQRGSAGGRGNQMFIPDFFKQSSWRCHIFGH